MAAACFLGSIRDIPSDEGFRLGRCRAFGLRKVYAQAVDGIGHVVAIEADTGIGKTGAALGTR